MNILQRHSREYELPERLKGHSADEIWKAHLQQQHTIPLPLPPSQLSPKGKRWRVPVLIGVVALLLLSIGLGACYLFLQRSTSATQVPVLGSAFFVSSGQWSEGTDQGINDELVVDLHNLPAPAPGKSYYAWLLSEKGDNGAPVILLKRLTGNSGKAHFLYEDSEHRNLLASTSRLLITEEDASQPVVAPSSNPGAWRYYAELARTPALGHGDTGGLSLLDHLRYLLSGDPKLDALQLRGGLNFWLSRNTKKVFEWAVGARDDWKSQDVQLMREQFIRILDYLDGPAYVQTDVAPGTPLLVNPQIALLEFDVQHQDPSGYIIQVARQLQGMQNAPGVTDEQRQIIYQLNQELNNMNSWLSQVRQDAIKLEHMTDTELLLPSSLSLLNDMTAQALYAYIGRLAPDTNQVQGGAVQVGYDLQRLTHFDIRPFIRNH